LGIVYTHTNYFQLEHRLQDIAHQLGLRNVDELYAKAKVSIEGLFKNLLLDLATNNETSFYRDIHIFKAISKLMVPDLKKRYDHLTKINLWSAASSSGQEIYSIAMEIDIQKNKNSDFPNFDFLASDISDTILKRAKEGVYSQLEVQRGLPVKNLVDYFDQFDETQWRVKEFLKKNIEFKKINLLERWSNIGPFEIIFCRNVLIYQNVENKKKVIDQFIKVMRPGSFLVLGAAESLFGISDAFEQVTDDKTIVYRLRG
jgi:chemotaxis protein methyltransferase CheR